jgi:DNA polymerase
MRTIVLDYETYYDDNFSLRKMTPVEYIKDPRFEVIGCAVKDGDAPAVWMTDHELRAYLKTLPEKVIIVSHNALFDMCILSWVHDYVPHMMIDTLGMARAWLGYRLKSLALSSVALHLGIGAKGDTVHKVSGMNLAAIKQAGFYEEYAAYSVNDAELCWSIYRSLIADGFPASEIGVMDTVLRCAVQPKFVLDQTLLAEHLHYTITSKQNLMTKVGMSSRDDLLSNDKFAVALRSLGVEPPTKISLVTGNEAYAFAKTDAAFIELEEHEDPQVQALVAARLGVKSTLEETRTERLMNIARLTWQGNITGLMPMPLRYSGAHTHRLSGDWKINMQNLPSRGNNKIRSAIKAPGGHQVLAVDASQIEARIAAWFAGQTSMVDAFANGEDIYSSFASEVFGYPVNKKDHKVERFIGKTAVLGLQYGLGWAKFQKTVAMQSKAQVGQEVVLSDEEAARVVNKYRDTYSNIPQMWTTLNNSIRSMTEKSCRVEIGPIIIEHERVVLPSGLRLHYHNLENKNGWWFTFGGKPKYIYGGKMLENVVQALARICVMDSAVRVRRRLKEIGLDKVVWLNLQVHDELVYVVPNEEVGTVEAIVLEEMRRPPKWGQNIPLDAESGVGFSYGDAK